VEFQIVETSQRIRYHETDLSSGANERAFMYWFDSARSVFYRSFPLFMDSLKSGNIKQRTLEMNILTFADKYCDYDDELVISSKPDLLENGTLRFDYNINLSQNGMEIAKGYSVHCFYMDGEQFGISRIREFFIK
jgi:acyl-CoA thioesterase FadM